VLHQPMDRMLQGSLQEVVSESNRNSTGLVVIIRFIACHRLGGGSFTPNSPGLAMTSRSRFHLVNNMERSLH
jgi:hypothetical protein